MSEGQNKNPPVDVDKTYLKSKRGILKVAEMVRMFAHQLESEHVSVCRGSAAAEERRTKTSSSATSLL